MKPILAPPMRYGTQKGRSRVNIMSIAIRLLIVVAVFAAAIVAAYFVDNSLGIEMELGSMRSASALPSRLPELLGGTPSRSGHTQTKTLPSRAVA